MIQMAKYRKSKVYSLICNKKSQSEKEEVKLEISDGYNNGRFWYYKDPTAKSCMWWCIDKTTGLSVNKYSAPSRDKCFEYHALYHYENFIAENPDKYKEAQNKFLQILEEAGELDNYHDLLKKNYKQKFD